MSAVTLSGTGAQGTSYTTDNDGRITLSFTGNKSVTIGGIPNGIHYTVVETQANTDGSTTTATNNTGIIETDVTKHDNFVNSKPSAGQVDLVAVKTTSGGTLSPTGFEFELVDSSTGEVLQTKTATEGNTVTFEPITYTTIGLLSVRPTTLIGIPLAKHPFSQRFQLEKSAKDDESNVENRKVSHKVREV